MVFSEPKGWSTFYVFHLVYKYVTCTSLTSLYLSLFTSTNTYTYKKMPSVKSVLVLLIVGCIISCEVNAGPQGWGRCNTPGKSFYDGCNRCGCSLDGYITVCTKRHCPINFSGPIEELS